MSFFKLRKLMNFSEPNVVQHVSLFSSRYLMTSSSKWVYFRNVMRFTLLLSLLFFI